MFNVLKFEIIYNPFETNVNLLRTLMKILGQIKYKPIV